LIIQSAHVEEDWLPFEDDMSLVFARDSVEFVDVGAGGVEDWKRSAGVCLRSSRLKSACALLTQQSERAQAERRVLVTCKRKVDEDGSKNLPERAGRVLVNRTVQLWRGDAKIWCMYDGRKADE
jgi:hypothetical protein